jgi:negative regulator of sigma E activity
MKSCSFAIVSLLLGVIARADEQSLLLEKFAASPALTYRAEIKIGADTAAKLMQVQQGQLRNISGANLLDSPSLERPDFGQPNPSITPVPSLQQVQRLKALFASYQTTWLGSATRIADRQVRQIKMEPRDGWRYSRILWLDVQTGLPLRSQIFRRKELIEQMQVQRIELVNTPAIQESTTAPIAAKFAIRNIPVGFVLQQVHSSNAQIQHLYTDGVSQVSIFVQAPGALESYGKFQTGAMSYLAKRIGQIDVIGVGDVPPATLERMVSGVESLGN